jgi:truncated hemoglobin YjbI
MLVTTKIRSSGAICRARSTAAASSVCGGRWLRCISCFGRVGVDAGHRRAPPPPAMTMTMPGTSRDARRDMPEEHTLVFAPPGARAAGRVHRPTSAPPEPAQKAPKTKSMRPRRLWRTIARGLARDEPGNHPMQHPMLTALAAACALCLASACPGGGSDDNGTSPTDPDTTAAPTTAGPDDSTTAVTPTGGSETTGTGTDTGANATLCDRLGGVAGIGLLVDRFLNVVLTDDRINVYFLRNDADWARLRGCIVDQLGSAIQCPDVAYACMDMKTAHLGMGISMIDFGDFAEDFSKAWDGHQIAEAPDLTAADKDDVMMILGGSATMIIEDTSNNESVYQRVGRKPAIEALIDLFLNNVLMDPTIAGFFDPTPPALERLRTCLVRQVAGIEPIAGLQTYGRERDDFPPGIDPGPTMAMPCRDMVTAHTGVLDQAMLGIDSVDFNALVTALVNAMTTLNVTMADQQIVIAALKPVCPMITVDAINCPP